MKIIIDDKLKILDDNFLLNSMSFKRLKERDKLCEFEDSIFKKYDCMYLFDDLGSQDSLEKFLSKDDESINLKNFNYLTTLRYSDNRSDFKKIKELKKLYDNDYYNSTNTDEQFANMPTGYLNSKIVFIGEAPGWGYDLRSFGARVYTFGRTSMIFRLLSSVIFGNCWYTNISKAALVNNDKPNKDQLNIMIPKLKEEISIINENVIVVCLGNFVYECLQNEFDKVFKIFHPAYIARVGNNIELYRQNMLETKSKMELK